MDNAPKYSLLEAKQKMEHWCAYQERCAFEARSKLQTWKMHFEDIDVILADLISNNFINEERFAEAFVSGKFKIKRWGRIKIKQELKRKRISEYSIKKAMATIDGDAYWETLCRLRDIKSGSIKAKNHWDKKAKLMRFLSSKGFESDLIREAINELNEN